MELNKTKRWFYAITTVAALFILSLGAWWLYLIFKLANILEGLNISELTGNLLYMVKWEGISFILVMLVLTFFMLYIFIQDRKKTQAISAFFASLTHELKTPLASIRLQGQVIAELIEELKLNDSKLLKYIERLTQDTIRLENELDRSLQLSRLEKGGVLNLHPVNLNEYIIKLIKLYPTIEFKLDFKNNCIIMADELALKMILRNLVENTIKHNKKSAKTIHIEIFEKANKVIFTYFDNGDFFSGELNKLGNLFYKHLSPSGSGIGLYLIKKLTKSMGGSFKIFQTQVLHFQIDFIKQHE